MQQERVERYLAAAERDLGQAFRLYLWNCALCEAFHVPLHFAEITTRNAMQRGLASAFGEEWYENRTFQSILDRRFEEELRSATEGEMAQHNGDFTAHHATSALTFGFWEHIATKRFKRTVWRRGVTVVFRGFPQMPPGQAIELLHGKIESVRRWRNRIAHHNAIFDKGPHQKFQDSIELIKYVCADTADYVNSISRVSDVINSRPDIDQPIADESANAGLALDGALPISTPSV